MDSHAEGHPEASSLEMCDCHYAISYTQTCQIQKLPNTSECHLHQHFTGRHLKFDFNYWKGNYMSGDTTAAGVAQQARQRQREGEVLTQK